jgi:transcriptional regulator with XRE-family HTH domain
MFKKTERKEKKAMPKTRKGSSIELYNSHFAATLRELMEKNGTTQKEIATAVGIRPQTLSLYCIGETQPNVDKLLKIAEFFNVTTDYLITGTVLEDIPAREMFGLSERTIENMKLVKDGYFEDSPYMLPLLDRLLGDKDFYESLDRAAKNKALAAHNEEQADFYEWKAAQALQDYLLDFLSKNLNVTDQ